MDTPDPPAPSRLRFSLPQFALASALYGLSFTMSDIARNQHGDGVLIAMSLCGACLGSGTGALLGGYRSLLAGAAVGLLLGALGARIFLPRM